MNFHTLSHRLAAVLLAGAAAAAPTAGLAATSADAASNGPRPSISVPPSPSTELCKFIITCGGERVEDRA